MRNFSLTGRFTFDEVQRLIDCTFGLAPENTNHQRCTLNVDRQKSLPTVAPVLNCFATRLRPARTPPSTFLFLPIHFSNSPGTMAAPTLRSAGEPSKPMHPNTIGCCFTIPVRSFRGAQSRRKRTARRKAYIGFAPCYCQPKTPDFAHAKSPDRASACGLSRGVPKGILSPAAPY
jgi:hypothetical protein